MSGASAAVELLIAILREDIRCKCNNQPVSIHDDPSCPWRDNEPWSPSWPSQPESSSSPSPPRWSSRS